MRLPALAFAVLASACSGLARHGAGAGAPSACHAPSQRVDDRLAAQPYDSGLPSRGEWRDGFDLADMDGDGALDLLHGPARKGRREPTIFRGDGAGRFDRWTGAHFPPLPYDYGDAKAADFNGDGSLDIALSAHLRGIVVLMHEGQGRYAPWGEGLGLHAPGSDEPRFASRSLAVTDWNRDGRTDLLALNEGPSRFATEASTGEALALYLNRGGYWDRARPALPLRGFGDALAVGHVDGDGQPDALLGTQVAGARLLLQLGTTDAYASRELRALPPRAAVTAVALHDFDRDGRDEALLATRAIEDARYCTGLQVVAWREPDAESSRSLWGEASRDPVVALAIADLDGDGRDDVVAVRRLGAVMTWTGRRHGFRRDLALAPPPAQQGCLAYDAKLADLDGDGAFELVVAYAGDDGAGNGCTGGGGFATWRLAKR